ncbi:MULTISPECIES: alpha/beta hydrolase [Listeria]|uniref:alpha/beta hydrolase n=1 Tax=Listeria TaxID=1637 RepID=UPI000B589834|nr:MULTISPECIES: alpha/beta hydrolase [Listeria]
MKKIIGFSSVVIVVLLAIWGYFYFNTAPNEVAEEAANPTQAVNVFEENNTLIFEPKKEQAKTSVILYPGAFVNALSYAPLAKELADSGYKTYVVEMPLDLAVFGKNKAEAIMNENADEQFVIGGHSLGGVMAARFAHEHASDLRGVFFLASYPDKKGSLKQSGLPVLSITASNDGVLNFKKFEENKKYLSNEATFLNINGGNHAQFGSYGKQSGDHDASISAAKQTAETAEAITNWLQNSVN